MRNKDSNMNKSFLQYFEAEQDLRFSGVVITVSQSDGSEKRFDLDVAVKLDKMGSFINDNLYLPDFKVSEDDESLNKISGKIEFTYDNNNFEIDFVSEDLDTIKVTGFKSDNIAVKESKYDQINTVDQLIEFIKDYVNKRTNN